MNARDPQQDAQWNARRPAVMSRDVGVMTDRYTERAGNALFWDVEGRHYVDPAAGTAVVNTGHYYPRLVQAVHEQLDYFMHTAFQIALYGSCAELAEHLNTITPGTHTKKTVFFTTGAEAVGSAIKIARAYTDRLGVIALTGTFHGRTFMGMSSTGKMVPYKTGLGPSPGSICHVSTSVALHSTSTQDTIGAIQRLLKADIDPCQVAAIIFGPVQGEDGFYQVPADFVYVIRTLCDEHGIVMIVDEVQTGFARTGKLFVMEYTGMLLDITTMAKGLAGGLLLLTVTGRAEIMDAPALGGLGGTYTGNPLAVASARVVFDIIAGEKLCEHSVALGARPVDTLNTAKAKRPHIVEVCGVDVMAIIEFSTPDGKPDADFTKLVQQRVLEVGLPLLSYGVYGNVIRSLFPLMIEDAVFEEGLTILQRALED